MAFVQISAGRYHTCGVLAADDSVRCWGVDTYGQSSAPDGAFKQVAAGWDHTCGVRQDGVVACWGRDEDGESTPPPGW